MVSDETVVVSNGYSLSNHSDKHHKSSHKSKDNAKDKHKHKDRDKERDKDRHKDHRDKDKHPDREKHRDKDKHRDKSKDVNKDKEKEKHSTSTTHKSSSNTVSQSSSNHKSHKRSSDDKKLSSSSSSHHHHHQHSSHHHSSHRSSSSHHKSKSSLNKDKHKSNLKHEIKTDDSAEPFSDNHNVKNEHVDIKEEIKEEFKSQPLDYVQKDLELEQNTLENGNSLDSSCDYDFNHFKTKQEEDADFKRNRLSEDDDDEDDVKKEIEEEESFGVKKEQSSDEDDSLQINSKSRNRRKIDSEDDNDEEEEGENSSVKKEEFDTIVKEDDEKSMEVDDNEFEEEEEEEEKIKRKSKKNSSKRRRGRSNDDFDDDNDNNDGDHRRKRKKKRGSSPVRKREKAVTPKKEIKEEDENFSSGGVKKRKSINTSTEKSPKKVKKEEVEEVWKWWEEEKKDDGVKWSFLEHKGPLFAPVYEPLPKSVKFFYDGKHVELSQDAEEIAGFYARMLDHDYTTKDIFNTNFFKDWRKSMTHSERKLITDLNKCNFKQMHSYFLEKAEQNRNRTKEEKKALKEKNDEIANEYGFCVIDGHKEKIANFKIEPPGLFRGRGEHPRMGMLKRRVMPEDVIINCSKDSTKPKAPDGHKWKEIRHDCTVTWLASWTENVQNQVKYVMLNPSSKIKGEKDWQKYEMARKLAKCIDKIRAEYREDWKSKEMRVRQRAVALYFIDRLALRAGNEKDEDQADTVGCCSLRVEHIQLDEHKDGKDFVVIFDFLGKDSIRYYNEVPVEKRVFKNLQLFMENKAPSDDLFDRLNTAILNKHLTELMPGLTAKVFRTYNASSTLQDQLDKLTDEESLESEKILSYNRANRAVAILCNHQRSIPKTHQKSMDALREKIEKKKESISEAETKVSEAKRNAKRGSVKEKTDYERKKKQLERLREQLIKLEVQETDRDENKTIALGTSKLNYLDPRISVAWCKKYNVAIEKVYNKTQRSKFRWAIDMAGPDFRF